MKNQDFELEIFGRYTDTHDEKYLNDLRVVADNYRAAIANTSIIVVPADAIPSHVKILNAMAKFTSVLDGLIENAHDPFATAVVLKAFTVVEGDMVTSFNDIGAYAAHKLL